MDRVAWLFLGVFWALSALVCGYGAAQVVIWRFLATGDEPQWFDSAATIIRALFAPDSDDKLRASLEVAFAGIIAFAAGSLGTEQKKSLWLVGVCLAFVLIAASSYFLFGAWALYGGKATVLATKQALAAVTQLNIILVGAHLGLKLSGNSPKA